jgi:hypothetical protein
VVRLLSSPPIQASLALAEIFHCSLAQQRQLLLVKYLLVLATPPVELVAPFSLQSVLVLVVLAETSMSLLVIALLALVALSELRPALGFPGPVVTLPFQLLMQVSKELVEC